jgi:5'-methylthioadenosine phosphorylase
MESIEEQVKIGVIGGSGLYAMEGLTDIRKVTLTTPFGPPSDSYIIGSLAGQRVAFLPRHGVGHRFLPHEIPVRANIHGFKQLGVKHLISVSAVGSLREEYAPGHVVIPHQIFDATKGLRPCTFFGEGIAVHVQFNKPFDDALGDLLYEASRMAGAVVHRAGTYTCIEGPQFSTLAESEEYRRRGHDVIGMTAVPEAKLAREAEMAYALLAMVTDYDCWHADHDTVNVEMVLKILHKNVQLSQEIIRNVVPIIGDGHSPAHSALNYSIVTRREVMPAEKLRQVELLIGKYIKP